MTNNMQKFMRFLNSIESMDRRSRAMYHILTHPNGPNGNLSDGDIIALRILESRLTLVYESLC